MPHVGGRLQLKCDGTRWRTGKEVKWKTCECSGHPVLFTLPRNMVYPALLPLMRTPRLPVVNWTNAPSSDLNGLVRFPRKTEIWFLCVCHHISTGLYHSLEVTPSLTLRHEMLGNTAASVSPRGERRNSPEGSYGKRITACIKHREIHLWTYTIPITTTQARYDAPRPLIRRTADK